jgi:hypothetical protein
MKTFSLLLLASLLQLCAFAQAAKKTPPSPAKTTCIKLLNGSSKDAAAARAELKKSTRFKLVEDCAKSDMSIWISTGSPAAENLCRATVQALGPDQSVLWSDTRTCKTNSPATVALLVRHMLIDLSTKKTAKSSRH